MRRLSLAAGSLAGVFGAVGLRLLGVDWAAAGRWEYKVGTAAADPSARHSSFNRGLDVLLLVAVPLGVVLLAPVVARLYRRGERALAVACTALVAGSFATTELLKAVLGARPDMPSSLRNGYPSGHTTIAFATGVVLMLAAPWRGRVTPAAAAGGYVAFVVGGIVLDGWHLPTDTVGALCVTAAWTFAVLAVLDPPTAVGLEARDVVGAIALAAGATLILLTHAGVPSDAPRVGQVTEAVALVATAATTATLAVGYAIRRLSRLETATARHAGDRVDHAAEHPAHDQDGQEAAEE